MRLVFLIALFISSSAFATLGENIATSQAVANEKAKFKASSLRVEKSPLYSVQVLDAEGLTTVREYSNSEGVVFAVTWKGMSRPDLQALFGSYYDEYQNAESLRAASEGPKQGRREVSLKTTNLVVRRGGHMRAIRGRAQIASLVPSGVDPETLP